MLKFFVIGTFSLVAFTNLHAEENVFSRIEAAYERAEHLSANGSLNFDDVVMNCVTSNTRSEVEEAFLDYFSRSHDDILGAYYEVNLAGKKYIMIDLPNGELGSEGSLYARLHVTNRSKELIFKKLEYTGETTYCW